MHRSIGIFLVVLALLILLISSLSFAQLIPVEVKEAAERGLTRYLDTVPTEELIKCGLPQDFVRSDVVLADPLKVYFLDYDRFIASVDESPLSVVNETTLWFFPVTDRGEYVSILTVDFIGSGWKAVDLGKAQLAREVGFELSKYPMRSGYDNVFIMSPQLRSYFMAVGKDGVYRMYPFESARIALGIEMQKQDTTLYELNELMNMAR